MTTLPTYRNRGPGYDCIRLGTAKELCWGPVQGSSRGLECAGHAGGKTYQTPSEAEEAKAKAKQDAAVLAEAEAEKRRIQQEEWELNRWFRPLLDQAAKADPDPFLASLSNPLLCMVFSMIGEGIRMAGVWSRSPQPTVISFLEKLGLPLIAEIQRRGLEWPVGAYALTLSKEDGQLLNEKELAFDVSALPDLTLQLWAACSAEVVDYSCLDRGTRQAIHHIYAAVSDEMDRRSFESVRTIDTWTPNPKKGLAP